MRLRGSTLYWQNASHRQKTHTEFEKPSGNAPTEDTTPAECTAPADDTISVQTGAVAPRSISEHQWTDSARVVRHADAVRPAVVWCREGCIVRGGK